MALEQKFDKLEKKRPDYPKGKRMQPISASEPVNTLIWQYEFPILKLHIKHWTSSAETKVMKCSSDNR